MIYSIGYCDIGEKVKNPERFREEGRKKLRSENIFLYHYKSPDILDRPHIRTNYALFKDIFRNFIFFI